MYFQILQRSDNQNITKYMIKKGCISFLVGFKFLFRTEDFENEF